MTDARDYLLKAKNRFGTFYFEEPPYEDWLAIFGEEKTKKLEAPDIVARLADIEGVKHPKTGGEISVGEIKESWKSFPTSFITNLTSSFFSVWKSAMYGQAEDVKNEGAPAGT